MADVGKPSVDAHFAELERRIPGLIREAGVPGLAIAVVRDATVAWSATFGVRDADTREPVRDGTVFEAASLSKPVFAYGVLKLRERGKLDLDRPLAQYLPAPDPYLPDDPRAARITARMVLSHSAAIPNWRRAREPLPVQSDPGTVFAYSGEGYAYLQRVVEHLTGLSLAAWLRAQVLEPLGMPDSSYLWIDDYEGRATRGHDADGKPVDGWNARLGWRLASLARDEGRPSTDWRSTDERVARAVRAIGGDAPDPQRLLPNAAASLYTTAADFARFMLEFTGPAPDDPAHLSETGRAEMIRPQVAVADGLAWSLGWGVEHGSDGAAGDALWQWGDNGHHKNFALLVPAERRGVVVLTNGASGMPVCEELVRATTGRGLAAFAWLRR